MDGRGYRHCATGYGELITGVYSCERLYDNMMARPEDCRIR